MKPEAAAATDPIAAERPADGFRLGRASGLLLVVGLLALWEVSARTGWVASENWPPFSAVLGATWRGLASGELLDVVLSTLYRMAAGFGAGVVVGVALGLAMASFRWADALLEPLVELCRPIPVPAIVPPLILIFGIDDELKIFVVAFATVFPVLINTVQGVYSVSPTAIDVARTFKRSRGAILLRVVLPAALPYIAAGMRIALALALIVTVVAEMIAGSSGMGYYLVSMQYAMRPEDMYGAVVVLAAVAYLLNWLFLRAERRLLPWYHLPEA
jgi:ABC-type nitrate/sulfonate/bicarbonate transport system permease component